MAESLSTAAEKFGLPPGSLVHVGEVHDTESRITVVDYNKHNIERRVVQSIDEILRYRQTETVTWVNVDGLRDASIIATIGEHFDIHPLVLEDILSTHQRPKLEEYEHFLYIVLKRLFLEGDEFSIRYEQVSILLLNKFVFTFKERIDETFAPIYARLENERSRIRESGADYLAYVVLDTIVDEYFSLHDSMDELMESTENELLSNPTARTLSEIQDIKRELIFIRRSVSPLRELLAALQRTDSPLVREKTQRFLGDVYDHAIRVIEGLESYRDLVASMQEIYLSSISNKMNETMKVLTIFASIFIPLTFIAGVYGMNFEYMPELKLTWAYPVLWIVFVGVGAVLIVYFKKKHWM